MAKINTGDFVRNVLTALREEGINGALRADKLADVIMNTTNDGSHRFEVLDKLKILTQMEAQGLGSVDFELISAREQEGYGFSQDAFPRERMPDRPGVRKRTRKARKEVAAAAGTDETKQVNYWPIVALKDEGRASMRKDLGEIADFLHTHIQNKYGGRFDVVLGSKTLTVKFAGVSADEDSDEDSDESVDMPANA